MLTCCLLIFQPTLREGEEEKARPGHSSGSFSGNDVENFEYGQPNGYQRNYEGAHGYQVSDRCTNGHRRNGGIDVYRRDNGGAIGFRHNYGTTNGYYRTYRGDTII